MYYVAVFQNHLCCFAVHEYVLRNLQKRDFTISFLKIWEIHKND